MAITTRFNYSNDKQITAMIADQTDNFLWVAFAQNSSGNCIIEKEAFQNPKQTYYSLDRAVTEIPAMDIDLSNVYVAYNDNDLIGEIISKTNPLSTTTDISKAMGESESPVDIKVNNTDLWFLFPGSASGTNAKLLKYNTSGTLQDTIELTKSGSTVTDAYKMDIDSVTGDIWISTNTTPGSLVRVYELSGGGYDFTVFT